MPCEEVCIGTNDYDVAEVYCVQMRKSRKTHRCCECGETIATGQRYEYASMIYEHEPFTFKTCSSCEEIRRHFTCGEGFVLTTLWEEIHEYVFPVLTLKCLDGLSPENKTRVIEKWRLWKGLP